jgi:hypothetical protein
VTLPAACRDRIAGGAFEADPAHLFAEAGSSLPPIRQRIDATVRFDIMP